MSQLDLTLAAAVSSRHVSFLETGRSQPSREMVRCLASALDLSMQVKNEMLTATGYSAGFERSPLEEGALDAAGD